MSTPMKDQVLAPTNATEQSNPDDAGRVAAAIAALGSDDDGGGDQADSTPDTSEPEPEHTPEPKVESRAEGEGDDRQEAKERPELESTRLAELSRRERRAREQATRRVQELEAREAKVAEREKELESELKTLRAQVSSQADAFYSDPVGALKAMGVTSGFGDLAHVLMSVELGEEPPSEFMSSLQGKRMETALERQKREMDEKLAEIETRRKQAEYEEFQRGYVGKMDAHVREVDASSMPFLRVWYDSEPAEVLEMMYADAVDLAQEDPSGPLPTAQNLANRLNQKLQSKLGPILAKLIELELAQSKEDESQADDASSTASTKTLRNAHSQRTNRTAPAKSEEERVERAIAALTDPAFQ